MYSMQSKAVRSIQTSSCGVKTVTLWTLDKHMRNLYVRLKIEVSFEAPLAVVGDTLIKSLNNRGPPRYYVFTCLTGKLNISKF